MKPTVRNGLFGPLLGLTLLGAWAASFAADDAAIPARWKVQEINYSYTGFTTAYNCDSAADKLKAILKTLGAHPSTRVRTSGCDRDRPSRNFFVTITLAAPVPAAELTTTKADQSKQELLKRLGVKNDISEDEFPATRQAIDLSQQRALDIRPGDCELLEGFADHVLPKLSAKVEQQRVKCIPGQVDYTPPTLRVTALVPVKSPDAKSNGGAN